MNKWLIKSRTMCLSHYIFGSRPPNRPIATTQKQIHTLAQILRCSFVCEKYTQEPTNDVPINCTNGIILKRPRPRAHIPTLMLKYEYSIVCEMSSACVSHRLWFWKRAHIPHYELMQSPSICKSWVAVCVCALCMISHFVVHHAQDRTSKVCKIARNPTHRKRSYGVAGQKCARREIKRKPTENKNRVNVKQPPA